MLLRIRTALFSVLGVLILTSFTPAEADVKLHTLFSEGAVLQQKTPVRIYGTAAPGEKVTVALQGQTEATTADAQGNWSVTLKPLQAGGPFSLTVTGRNKLVVNDILVGEVWVCSGQSNMEWNLNWIPEAKDDIVAANDPQLRMFTVPHTITRTPQTELTGGAWRPALPQFAGGFSAVGYYFGKALRESRKVPIGLIHTAWGGTRIEAWMRKETLESLKTPESEFVALDPNSPVARAFQEQYAARLGRWKAAGSPEGNFADPGIAASAKGFEAETFEDSGWSGINLPSLWQASGVEALQDIDGAVWFRRTFDLPAELSGKDLTLTLGAIDDFDTTYINGVKVGATGTETPDHWKAKRVYTVPAKVLKPGKNTIAVRVWDQIGDGGFSGKPDEMRLFAPDNDKAGIVLAGAWKFAVEISRPQNPGNPPGLDNPNTVTVLYNGMLHPLTKFSIAGAIWYQGESNAGRYIDYRQQLPAMIRGWRNDWNQGDFPFLIVQLAPFTAVNPAPADSNWAGLREAQWQASEVVPNVGTAIITDVGDPNDIHPRRKQPVGERLAWLARKLAYKETLPAVSPSMASVSYEENRAIVRFKNVGSGLEARPTDSAEAPVPPGEIRGFAIAGADGKFFWAEARFLGKDSIVLTAPQVAQPKAVRFGWADFPVVNLASKDGLPVAPFRTDTEGRGK